MAINHVVSQPVRDVIGYFPSWQWYRRDALVRPTTVKYDRYTIINYAFFLPKADGTIAGSDKWADDNLLLGDSSLVALAHCAGVKVLISVGGWSGSEHFSSIAASPQLRDTFVAQCVALIRQYDIDGIDLDWEYPGDETRYGAPNDRENFLLLLQNLRKALDTEGVKRGYKMLLTAAVSASSSNMAHIDWTKTAECLDIINLMSYDFYGAWDTITNHNAPLFAELGKPCLSVSVQELIGKYNVSPQKICLGIPFYGRSQTTIHSPNLNTTGTGKQDTLTFKDDEGTPHFYDLLGKLPLFDVKRDTLAQVPYAIGCDGLNTFVSFDDEISVEAKARYAVDNALRGVIIWELTGDYIMENNILKTPLADVIKAVFDEKLPPNNVTEDNIIKHR